MTRIVDDDPPIKTGPASAAYRDNYDRVFGTPSESGAEIKTHAEAMDAIECRLQCAVTIDPTLTPEQILEESERDVAAAYEDEAYNVSPNLIDRILGTTSVPLECGCCGAYVCDTHYKAMIG